MDTNSVLDVGFGLVTMYLMLSLACTVINEYIASVLRLRARLLAEELPKLIDDSGLRATFEQHGLIVTQVSAGGGRASYLSSDAFAKALLDSLNPAKPVVIIEDVVDAAKALPESNVRDAILLAATSAGSNIDKLRQDVSSWFDNAMNRLSGVYKRNLQWISLAVGFAIVVSLNADTASVTHALWRDGTLRKEMVDVANRIQSSDRTQLSENMKVLSAAESDFRPFPLGWTDANGLPSDTVGLVEKIVGLLLTLLSVSLGAPFWFDLLSKFMNLRMSGVKPASTQSSS